MAVTFRNPRALPPDRPCGECGGRHWRRRTEAPAGGWECAPCWDAALIRSRPPVSFDPFPALMPVERFGHDCRENALCRA